MNTHSCTNCSSDITFKPEFVGLNGILCFKCKYNYDESGGEAYFYQKIKHEKELSRWSSKYSTQWDEYNRRLGKIRNLEEIAGKVAFVLLFSIFFSVAYFFIFMFSLMVIYWFISKPFEWYAEKSKCPAPPTSPQPIKGLLDSDPEIFLSTNSENDSFKLDETYAQWNGYPPDWPERKRICLLRDSDTCQLCGKNENLHVHHVKPVSYFSNHNLKNLLTLCRTCHMKQGYWGHKALVRENIKAKRKFTVREYIRRDGVRVSEHTSKRGRRGNFWRMVRREKYKNLNKQF